jgi:hypothetical protein
LRSFQFLHLNHYIFSFSFVVSFYLHTWANPSNLPQFMATNMFWVVQGDQKVSVYLMITVQKPRKNMVITECVRNVDRATLNTVFENTVQRVNKCLETGGKHFEHYS